MLGRFFAIACWSFLPAVAEAEDARALTEAEVVARALRRAPLRDVLEGNVKLEAGRAATASASPNPQLSYRREQTFGSLGSSEDTVLLSQTIDLGNRRGLLGEAGALRARAARAEGAAERLTTTADARARFYELLYRQHRLTALDGWLTRIDKALAIVLRRERSGDAAAYERRRLERERAVAHSRLETERASLERARARIQAVLGETGGSPNVAGTLLPEADPPDLATLRTSIAARPDLQALAQQIEAAGLEQRAGSRGWVPELALEGGWKGIDFGDEGRSDGFALGASLSIPLWDRSAGLSQTAAGEAQVARGSRALLEVELGAELSGVRAEAVQLRRAALEFQERVNVVAADLVQIASAGYQGGELGLLELLDAYRGAAEDASTAFDLAYAARRARLELDRMTGSVP